MATETLPVYLKLRELIAAAIMDGVYPEGALLPSVRAFAAQQGANPLTVAKAYQQFQLDGIAVARRGIGIEVAPGAAARLRLAERERFLRQDWPLIRDRIRRLGIAPVDLLASDLLASDLLASDLLAPEQAASAQEPTA